MALCNIYDNKNTSYLALVGFETSPLGWRTFRCHGIHNLTLILLLQMKRLTYKTSIHQQVLYIITERTTILTFFLPLMVEGSPFLGLLECSEIVKTLKILCLNWCIFQLLHFTIKTSILNAVNAMRVSMVTIYYDNTLFKPQIEIYTRKNVLLSWLNKNKVLIRSYSFLFF